LNTRTVHRFRSCAIEHRKAFKRQNEFQKERLIVCLHPRVYSLHLSRMITRVKDHRVDHRVRMMCDRISAFFGVDVRAAENGKRYADGRFRYETRVATQASPQDRSLSPAVMDTAAGTKREKQPTIILVWKKGTSSWLAFRALFLEAFVWISIFLLCCHLRFWYALLYVSSPPLPPTSFFPAPILPFYGCPARIWLLI